MPRRSLPIIFSFLLPLAAAQSAATVSITGEDAYDLAKPCVQQCLWGVGPAGLRSNIYNDWYDVGKELGCGATPINKCYCEPRDSSKASSVISSYASYYCASTAVPTDLADALSIYNEYCASANGNPTKPVPVPVTASVTSSASSASETESETESPSPSEEEEEEVPSSTAASSSERTPTSSSSSETAVGADESETPSETAATTTETASSSGGGLSKGATIGVAVGASVGGIAVIAAIVVFWMQKRKRSQLVETPMGGIEKQEMGGIQGY